MNIVETEALSLRFGKRTAVDGLSLGVGEGEIFGLLGPNGAGKTTTIKMLTTLLPPTSGTARVDGFDIVKQDADVRLAMGYVPQLLSSDGSLTGYENLLYFARLYDVPRREIRQRVKEVLAYMGLEASADRRVREYSRGMIRRLEIAQAMLHYPKVLFLDEPTTGLDPLARRAVWERIGQLREDYNTTIFFSTHRMEEADEWCSRLAILHHGKLAAIGTPQELKASLGKPDATLDDVFVHYSGDSLLEYAGDYRAISRERRNARRLG